MKDKKEIVENVEVKISRDDIQEIYKRFDKYNTRLTAFAVLCFAKKYSDKNGMFHLSRVGLSNWIAIDQTTLSSRYMKELCDFDYIERVTGNEIQYIKRRNKSISKMVVYKMKVDYKNDGEYIFRDSNIRDEFEKIIASIEY